MSSFSSKTEPVWTISQKEEASMEIQRPLKAIRSKCLDCSGGQPKEVRFCSVIACSLWPYRLGKRPVKNIQKKHDHCFPPDGEKRIKRLA